MTNGAAPTGAARAEVVVDLDAIAANTAVLRERVARPLMAVVKADGYGHGLIPAARAVLAGGADQLGVAVLDEALALLRELDDPMQTTVALDNLATLHRRGGDAGRAASLLEEALALARAHRLDWNRAVMTGHLAHVAREQGDDARAVALYRERLGRLW